MGVSIFGRDNIVTTSLFSVLLFSILISNTFAADKRTPPNPDQPRSSAAQPTRTKDGACEKAWKQYHESAACFARYRNANGSVKAEAYKHCVEIAQPLHQCE